MDTQRLEKLKKLLELTNEGLTREEFLSSFQKVINQVLKLEAQILEKINKSIDELKQVQDDQKKTNEAKFKSLMDEVEDVVGAALKEQRNGLNYLIDKANRIKGFKDGKDGRDGINGRDGKDADESRVIKEVLKQIQFPDWSEQFQDIKEELEQVRQQRRVGGGFSKIAMESKFIDDETPTGTINGVNTVFTLANIPNPSTSVKVFVNGARMRITEDYTLVGGTITFLTAPPTGSIILVDYRH